MAPLESPAEGAGAEAAPQQQEVVQPSTIPRARSLRRTATFGERARDVSEQIAEEFANLRDTVAAFPQPEAFMEPEAEAPSEQEQDAATEVDSAIPAGSEHEQVVAAAVAATAGGAAAREEGKDAKKVKAKVVLLLDKVSFVLGVVLIYVSAFWIGWSPSTFYQLYVWLALVLFGCRFVYYYRRGLHYYMLDLCYWANFAAMVGLWFYPSPLLHKIVFAYNSGPLAWSIFAMRNSLVLHRFENLITLFMHWYPAMVSWTLRWHPSCAQRGTCDLPAEQQLTGPQWASASFVELGLLPMGFYAVWMVLYYLKLFVLSADKIKKRNYDTVYHWMIRNQKHPLTLLINRFPPWAQPLVYLAIHGCCCWLTFMSTYILWHSYWAHTAVICMLSIDAAWNGANFYFEVFAHRYIRALGLQLKPLKKKD